MPTLETDTLQVIKCEQINLFRFYRKGIKNAENVEIWSNTDFKYYKTPLLKCYMVHFI